ncbi:hypothetical protein V6Z11_A12G098200 [Gossypium hirsutum]
MIIEKKSKGKRKNGTNNTNNSGNYKIRRGRKKGNLQRFSQRKGGSFVEAGNESKMNLRFSMIESRGHHFYNNDGIDGWVKKYMVKLSGGKILLLHPSLNELFLTPSAQ